jgi:hypothetical protein
MGVWEASVQMIASVSFYVVGRRISSGIMLINKAIGRLWRFFGGVVLLLWAVPLEVTVVYGQTGTQASRPSQAEQWGPQFLFAWSAQEQATAAKALRALEGQQGIDAYLMARQARILDKIAQGFTFYDQDWRRIRPFVLKDAAGRSWTILQMTLPEVILTGFAVSRDRYCRPEEQDMAEPQATLYCFEMNRRAIDLFAGIENSRHMTPGGGDSR